MPRATASVPSMPLPVPDDGYDRTNEQQTRRIIEDRLNDLDRRMGLISTTVGTLSLSQASVPLVNGNNNDVSLGYATYVRATGPTGAFAITGIANGEAGRLVVVRNTTTAAMTISNESSSSSAVNRILTLTGADLVLTGSSGQAVMLNYDVLAERWFVIAKHESSDI